MRRFTLAFVFFFATAVLSYGCAFNFGPATVNYAGEPATISSIELLWPTGEGMGSFVDSTTSAGPPESAGHFRYGITLVFDDGQHERVTQDGSVALAVGTRVRIEGGRVVPHPAGDANSNVQRARF